MVQRLLEHLLEDTPAAQRVLTRAEILAVFDRAREGLDLSKYRGFSEAAYARNCVRLTDHFELVVICWTKGQESNVHDHGHSLCAYLVIEGEMTEDLYESVDSERARKTGERCFGAGESTISEGHDLHRIKNAASADLVTVHLYTPPMGSTLKIYREEDAELR